MRRIFAAAIAIGLGASAAAIAGPAPVYPQIVQTDHATPATARLLEAFFTAKSRHDVAKTMSFFSPDLATYTDATLGWPLDYAAVKGLFETYMPKWPATGLSYPVRILGGPNSVLVEFIDTKELFGGELRLFGAIDIKDGKVIRWVDYWDASAFDPAGYQQMRTADDKFPTDFKEQAVGENASPAIRTVSTALQDAFSKGDAKAAAALFSFEAVFEDRALHSQIVGQAAIERYLARALPTAPFGSASRLRHVVGGDRGGGFEWVAGPASNRIAGAAAIELDGAGRITRFSTVYDGRLLPIAARKDLAVLSIEP